MSPSTFTEHSATLVLELVTPLHIGSGEPEGTSDAGVVRDFNGLPGIPGTSLQGMLRAAIAIPEVQPKAVELIFGHTGSGKEDTGRGGRLSVGWGVIHNQDNKPVSGRISSACRDSDPVLRDAARPMLRDHMRLNERGAQDGRGKFDELVVSAGHRFTVELRFVTAEADHAKADDDWKLVKDVLTQGGLRVGGKTRRGLGAFKVVELRESKDTPDANPKAQQTDTSFSCDLVPETLWMFGGGTSESADSAPVRGTRIEWDKIGKGSVKRGWIVPGSAIKGALRHRATFHAHRLAGSFIDKPNKPAHEQAEGWIKELFGSHETGTSGKVFIDDVFLPLEQGGLAPIQDHVAINPFTGGAKDTALFNDEPLLPDTKVAIHLQIELRGVSDDAEERKPLAAAVEDLKNGRLALGAHVGRGYGIFKERKP